MEGLGSCMLLREEGKDWDEMEQEVHVRTSNPLSLTHMNSHTDEHFCSEAENKIMCLDNHPAPHNL